MTDRNDDEVAARLATQAGELLLGVRDELADASAAERKAEGDKRSHDFLMEALGAARPGDAVLSEEGADNPIRLSASECGSSTRWTAPANSPNSVATTGPYTSRCGRPVNSSRARSPFRRRALRSPRPTSPQPPAAPATPRIVVSRTRPPAIALHGS